MHVVEFLGGKHSDFNMGLWRRDVVTGIEAGDLRAVLVIQAENLSANSEFDFADGTRSTSRPKVAPR
jgi:CelD/BcsL family acetyltransferase involved in cellulose biosynthesis